MPYGPCNICPQGWLVEKLINSVEAKACTAKMVHGRYLLQRSISRIASGKLMPRKFEIPKTLAIILPQNMPPRKDGSRALQYRIRSRRSSPPRQSGSAGVHFRNNVWEKTALLGQSKYGVGSGTMVFGVGGNSDRHFAAATFPVGAFYHPIIHLTILPQTSDSKLFIRSQTPWWKIPAQSRGLIAGMSALGRLTCAFLGRPVCFGKQVTQNLSSAVCPGQA
jgi:hypothetical protein